MEAIILAALMTVDVRVRESPEYALAGQLAVFPDDDSLSRNTDFAYGHLQWLRDQVVLGPVATWVTPEDVREQEWVMLVYSTLQSARYHNANSIRYIRGESHWDEESQEWVEGSDAFNHERAAEKAEWLRTHLGREEFAFGELPAPVTSMRR